VDKKTKLIALSAIALALILIPIAPAGVPIIATVAIAIIVGWKKP
jgi:hypothetical protein